MGVRDLFRRRSSPQDAHQPIVGARSKDTTALRAGEARLAEGGSVSVSSEEHYQEALSRLRGTATHGTEVVAHLAINDDGNPWVNKRTTPIIEVQVGGETVGFLTPAMTTRYMPLVESAAREGRPVTANALVEDGSGKSGRHVEITLHAKPMWEGATTIAGLNVETTVEYVLVHRTGRAHELKSDDDGELVTRCGQRITADQGDLVYRTKPWVGRVRADGTILPDESPWWCSRCVPDDDDDEDQDVLAGGSFGEHTGINRTHRFSSRMTASAVETALASRLQFDCAGESYRPGYPDNLLRLAEVLKTMHGDEWLSCVLRRDPGNEHDPNAIEIHVPSSGHVGFVPAPLAKIIAPILDSGEPIVASAVEVRIHPDSPDKPGLTVALHREQRPTE